MADRMMFPIGFDLKAGIEEAAREWESRYAKKLESLIKRTPVKVKLKFDVTDVDALDRVKERLARLKLEPITPETKSAIKELASELRTLAAALAEVKRYSTGRITASPDAVRAARINEINMRASSKAATEHERARAAAARAEAAELRLARARERGVSTIHKSNAAMREQTTYVERLIKRLAVYASFAALGGFLTKIREVTAEFELQRISLGAIIQDQERANQLFAEIKNFALQSPLKILDLTKYTKQLAAYRIETDKLFDTTKRLADISVGLGVSMDRLVLFYGQVRATGYLRASEVRQATEAGIPLVEELARKLSQANGELVKASDVMDMISKRQISFEQVAEVFEDMTNKGGVFYDMQVKQGNTLYGMWQKLGDAAAMMYDSIGNTKQVSDVMRLTISVLRTLMLNWQRTAAVVAGFTAIMLRQILATKAASAANTKHIATLNTKLIAYTRLERRLGSVNVVTQLNIWATKQSIAAQIAAARSTNILTKSLYSLKAAMLANPWLTIIAAIGVLVTWLVTAGDEVSKLENKIEDINAQYTQKSKEMKDNFVRLADAATSSIDGSKKQKDALDELSRTYGNILGNEAIEIENLKNLKGKYQELTNIIEAYNEKRKGEERETAIKTAYQTDINELEQNLKDRLKAIDYSDSQIAKAFAAFKADVAEGADVAESFNKHISAMFKFQSSTERTFRHFGNLFTILWDTDRSISAWSTVLGTTSGAAQDYFDAVVGLNKALDENEKKTTDAMDALLGYSAQVRNLEKVLAVGDWSSKDALTQSIANYNKQHPNLKIDIPTKITFDGAQANTEFEKMLQSSNAQIQTIFNTLESVAKDYGVSIPEGFYREAKSVVEGNKDFSFIDFSQIEALANQIKDIPKRDDFKAAMHQFQLFFENIVPTDGYVITYRTRLADIVSSFKTLHSTSKVTLDTMTKYYMKSGQDIEDYAKFIKESIESIEKSIKNMIMANLVRRQMGLAEVFTEEDIQKLKDRLAILRQLQPSLPTVGKGSKRDERLGILKEMASDLQKINKEYQDLMKYEGNTKALADAQRLYAETLKNMQSLSKKYGFALPEFKIPTDTKSLTAYLKSIRKAMAKLPKSDKDVLALQYTIDKIDIDESQKNLEEQLKRLQEKVSQTKVAKEFYDKILAATGDVDIATQISVSVYGNAGEELFNATVEEIREVFKSGDINVEIPVDEAIDFTNQRINYAKLAEIYKQYQDYLIDKNKDTASKIVSEGQKTAAQNILNWEKELAKAKSYEEQRTDIMDEAYQERLKIIKEYTDQAEKDRLLKLSRDKEAMDLAKLDVKEFQSSEDYIKVFQDLDKVSSATLARMKERLKEMIATVQDVEKVEGLKALVEALEKIEQQQIERNPLRGIVQSFQELRKARKDYANAKITEARTTAEYLAKEPVLEQAITDARKAQVDEQLKLDGMRMSGLYTQEQIVAQERKVEELAKNTTKAEQEKANAYKTVQKAQQKTTDAQDNQNKAVYKFSDSCKVIASQFDAMASSVQNIASAFGLMNDEDLADMINGFVNGLQTAAMVMETISVINSIIAGTSWWMLAIGAVVGILTGVFTFLSGSKVRKANKIIEEQKHLVDELEYSYSRLEKAMEKAFGADYIKDSKVKKELLELQARAYDTMADAERSKGKKKDDDALRDYLRKAQELRDEIQDLKTDLQEYFLGTDLQSAARDFAKSWLDAYLSFESVTDAMKEKFSDMITNMIVEALAAKIIESSLSGLFNKIDSFAADGILDENDIAKIANDALSLIPEINNGMMGLMTNLKNAGLDLQATLSDTEDSESNFSGIARDIASASEESINGLAAGINTQNFFISQIHSDVAIIRDYIISGQQPTPVEEGVSVTDLVALQNTYLQHLPQIASNTAGTLERCERAAIACENMLENFSKVMTVDGRGRRAIATSLG